MKTEIDITDIRRVIEYGKQQLTQATQALYNDRFAPFEGCDPQQAYILGSVRALEDMLTRIGIKA